MNSERFEVDTWSQKKSGGARKLAPPPKSYNAKLRCCFQRLAGGVGNRGKRGRIMHGQVGKNLPVDFETGELQAIHEDAVAHVVLASRRVDTRDPQLAEITLLRLAIAVGVLPAALDGL